ncbi:FAD-linked oxidase C-terminal domain-containing protein [Neorhizobium sp. NPDC001467]|uniref:FAD-linked oxidase C-terminal domain-containing protein n=1 Tax=Neorhizobium sp. NPDC001467 TaxID=3390595 RepID=UPI003D04C55F
MLSADISIPVSAVPRFLTAASAAVRTRFPAARLVVVSHMGDGNVHFGSAIGTGAFSMIRPARCSPSVPS